MPPTKPAAAAKKAPKKTPEEKATEEANRVQVPDKAEYEEKVAKISAAIDALIQKQAAKTKEINEQSVGKAEFFEKRNVLHSQLKEFRSKIDEIQQQKSLVNQDRVDIRQEIQNMKQDLNKARRNLRYENEEDIDSRIREIDFKLQHETISLKAEKDLMKEISDLKKSRPQIAKFKNMEESFQNRQPTDNLQGKLENIHAEMKCYIEGKKKVMEELRILTESRKKDFDSLNDLYKERDALKDEINDKKEERDKLHKEYKEKEREYRAYERELKEEKWRKIQEEREKQHAEYKLKQRQREVEKLDEDPHAERVHLIEQTMTYCRSLISTKETEVKAEKKEVTHNLPEGAQLLSRKEDREEEYFLVPTAKKKSKSKNKGSKAEGASKNIKHNAHTFSLFSKLSLDAPVSTDSIPDVLEQLEKQLEEYNQKSREHKDTLEERKRKVLEGDGETPAAPDEEKVNDVQADAES